MNGLEANDLKVLWIALRWCSIWQSTYRCFVTMLRCDIVFLSASCLTASFAAIVFYCDIGRTEGCLSLAFLQLPCTRHRWPCHFPQHLTLENDGEGSTWLFESRQFCRSPTAVPQSSFERWATDSIRGLSIPRLLCNPTFPSFESLYSIISELYTCINFK